MKELFLLGILRECGFTKRHFLILNGLSLREWRLLIAQIACETGGRASFDVKRWQKLNEWIHKPKNASSLSKKQRLGRLHFGHCGVASWLYAAVKNKRGKQCKIKYYKDAEHVTVICGRSEIDITAPQHCLSKMPFGLRLKKSRVILLSLSQLKDFAKNDKFNTTKRFKIFAEGAVKVLATGA